MFKSLNKGKHLQKEEPKEIIIREKDVDEGDFYDSPEEANPDDISEEELLSYDPENEEDIEGESGEKRKDKKEKKGSDSKKIIKRAVIISVIAVILSVTLVFVFAGGSYSFKNALINIQSWFTGTDIGDGFPVGLTGSNADKMGFFSMGGSAYILTDSTFSNLSSTGEENFSHRHSCSYPAVSYSGGNYIIYDMGSGSYMIGSGSDTPQKFTSENNINAADISKSGRYAVFTQSQDYSAELLVYNKNNELIYTYKYAENYPVAAAVSPDGSKAAAVTVNENGGELYCVIAVFDLSNTEPVAQYVTAGNFITELWWEDGSIFALGNKAVISCDSYNNFEEYTLDGATITASDYNSGKLFVSVSAYDYAGASVLYIFDGSASNVKTIELTDRIEDISCYGGYVSLLVKKAVVCYDLATLTVVSGCETTYDTVSIAMANETGCYTLGVTEVNFIPLSLYE